jgi:hypothetical protein
MKTKEKIITLCKPYDFEKYKDIDLNSLVVYVIDFLGKNGISLSFENICVATFLMFPKKFSLLDFDEYPDTTRVNRVLLHLRPKYENLAEGNVKSGFILTERGKLKVKTARSLLNQESKAEHIETRPKFEDNRIIEVKDTIAFKKYNEGNFDELQIDEVYGFLQATPYTSKKNIRQLLNQILSIAKDKNDTNLEGFINSIKKKFGYLFKGD